MPGVPITFACGLYDRMLALYTKEVKPDGIDLNFLPIDHPREIFDRMMKLEFEASEMSSSDYARYAVRGDCPMIASKPYSAPCVIRSALTSRRSSMVSSAFSTSITTSSRLNGLLT